MIRHIKIFTIISFFFSSPILASENFITLVGTTSTDNSGLYKKILPLFTNSTGINVRVISVGTGRAINIAKNGDADILLVHHRKSEDEFVSKGFGLKRYDVMYNDFIVVGPKGDPANILNARNAKEALGKIASTKNLFVSRGDDSGTHKKELLIWRLASINVKKASGDWYREAGAGMGATLNTTAAMLAYTLTDRGTWLNFKNQKELRILFENDRLLLNPYGVILINPILHPHVKKEMGQIFIEWITGIDGQSAIASYRVNGHQAFFPNSKK